MCPSRRHRHSCLPTEVSPWCSVSLLSWYSSMPPPDTTQHDFSHFSSISNLSSCYHVFQTLFSWFDHIILYSSVVSYSGNPRYLQCSPRQPHLSCRLLSDSPKSVWSAYLRIHIFCPLTSWCFMFLSIILIAFFFNWSVDKTYLCVTLIFIKLKWLCSPSFLMACSCPN